MKTTALVLFAGLLALAVPAAWLGLRRVGADLWLQALPWLALLAFLFLFHRFTRQGRRVDTYEAIWGPKPAACWGWSFSITSWTKCEYRCA